MSESRRAPSLETVGLALTLSAIFALSSFPILNTDYWWHLLTGRMIVEGGALPTRDSLSFTATGLPWLNHEWLAEVVFYLLHAAFGVRGVLMLNALVMTAAFLFVYQRARIRGASAIVAQTMLLPGFLATVGSVYLRIQPVSLLMLSVYLFILEESRGSGRRRLLVLLPALMLLWTNLHGGFAVGPAVILIAVGAAHLERSRAGSAPRRDLAALWGAFAATVAAAAVNPNGLPHLLYPFRFLTPNYFTSNINESQRPSLADPVSLLFFALLAAFVFLLVIRRRRLSWFDSLLAAAFTFLALSQLRHISLWAIVVTPMLAAAIHRETAQPGAAVPRRRREIPAGARWGLFAAGPLVTIAVALMLTDDNAIRSLEQRRYPSRAADFLRTRSGVANVFTEYGWGGYVLWRLHPPVRVFIDGRADTVYPDDVLRRYLAIRSLRPGWREELHGYAAEVALLDRRTALARALEQDAGWQRIYADDVAVAFARR